MPSKIVVKGARVHNLKNIDVEIPRDKLVVITGVSGSGKSSLAFDTLYAEGQRRYLESLAADARQFLQQMEKPDVDIIEGLAPAIAVQQKAGLSSPRSTVGTLTEIYDYLRLFFARVGQPTCIQCGSEIAAQTIEQISDQLLSLPENTRIVVLSPIALSPEPRVVLQELARMGFVRVRIDGQIHELSQELQIKVDHPPQAIELIVDRLVLRPGIARRLADSLEVASRFGRQVIKVEIAAGASSAAAQELVFTQRSACIQCGLSLPEITPRLFSFNSPHGACPACKGLGIASKPRRGAKGAGTEVDDEPCAECKGTRLRKESLAVKVAGKSIANLTSISLVNTRDFLQRLELGKEGSVVGRKLLHEVSSRLQFLIQLGLDYLTLDRSTVTLSSGEAQRVRLATQLGSNLAGVLYILDEPSIGLHQKDNAQLVKLLKQLRDSGNTVIVVEHDPETILAADHVIDMGPGAGVTGGEIVAEGRPAEITDNPRSLTGQYLSGRMKPTVSVQRRSGTGEFLVIKGAKEHNLKDITVQIPVGALTCVTGVSGSGKTSLVMDILYNAAAAHLQGSNAKAGRFDELMGADLFDRVIGIDQAPIGRTPRSNPATYTGLFDHLRSLFAQLPEARLRGYRPERFSFNAPGGRCEACAGEGVVRVEMYFLPPVYVACENCKGRRYNRETLEIKYKGLSVADVLDLTVHQASEILSNIPALSERLRALREVGLGYLRLGQAAQTLSGGEAQRVKLARELARKSTGRSLYILDEPTTGLHFDDVKQLMELLHRLTDAGNTVVIIEHNLDVIITADYVIDLGPEGGDRGGTIVARGTPEEIAASPDSFTGQYLAKLLPMPSRRMDSLKQSIVKAFQWLTLN
jgi:excinuclease ABC subunit A